MGAGPYRRDPGGAYGGAGVDYDQAWGSKGGRTKGGGERLGETRCAEVVGG